MTAPTELNERGLEARPTLTADQITEQWGERCSDFNPECPCCQLWAFYDALASLSAAQPGWREITEDDRPPNDTDVIMGCWETWPEPRWHVEYGLYGSTKGGWVHGRMTHWLPRDILPPAPALGGE